MARTESQKAIHNLLKLVEQGALSPTDSDIVERIASHRQRERSLAVEIGGLERQLHISKRRITDAMIARFGERLAAALRDGDANFRRRYVSLLVDRVEVSNDTIRLCGSRHAIEHALIAGDNGQDGAVPIFDRNWCPVQVEADEYETQLLLRESRRMPPLAEMGRRHTLFSTTPDSKSLLSRGVSGIGS